MKRPEPNTVTLGTLSISRVIRDYLLYKELINKQNNNYNIIKTHRIYDAFDDAKLGYDIS